MYSSILQLDVIIFKIIRKSHSIVTLTMVYVFQDDFLFRAGEHVSPMDGTSKSDLSPDKVSTPVNVKYVESIDCDEDKVTTVRVPFQRERKVSKVYQSPYMQQPKTTPRRQIKRHVKTILPKVIGPDGKEIQLKPWKEVFSNIFFF